MALENNSVFSKVCLKNKTLMKLRNLITYSAFFIGIIFFLSCNDTKKTNNDPGPDVSSDRTVLLTRAADSIIIPSYEIFKGKMDDLVSKSESFRTNPTKTNLSSFRQSWVDAYLEWQKVELFQVGPADNEALRSFFNIYPCSTTNINANILSENANFELPATYSAQGFPALDYLINGLAVSDDSIITYYTSKSDATKRLNYIKKITDQMNSKFSLVYSSWKGSYRADFISKSAVNSTSSISLLINAYVMNYERYIRAGKFGIPSGVMVSGSVYPEKVEGFYKKDLSLSLAKAAHQASIDFFKGKSRKTGASGYSLKTYLDALNAKDSKTGTSLSESINSQFTVANNSLTSLNADFTQQIASNNTAMVNSYNEMQKVVRMLKVDMTSAMSITITYTDNDGD